uniref:MAX-like protein X n=2 Tax=Nothobranchius TaxID=28779 RepID=A0A1A8TXF6_NOTFU
MTDPEEHWKTDGAFSDSGFDTSFFAETARKGSIVSRANSIGSTSASSVPNTDDEDSDYRHETSFKDSFKDRRRQAHTQAEQKRRDAIKKGYGDLQSIVPTCQQQSEFAVGAQKISKATVLQKSRNLLQFEHFYTELLVEKKNSVQTIIKPFSYFKMCRLCVRHDE